jgi:hypothetical protein
LTASASADVDKMEGMIALNVTALTGLTYRARTGLLALAGQAGSVAGDFRLFKPQDWMMTMRISRTSLFAAAALALIVLLMAMQFGPSVFGR